MFLKNTAHMQQDLFGIENHLSESKRKKLRTSMEAAFYKLIFCNIREEDFSVLYSRTGSRPNAPVNTLVAAIILQQKKGWTMEALFERIDFDLLTRTALGLHNLEDTPFCPASFFNFQNRLLKHYIETNENLIERVFDRFTAEQLKQLKIKTDIQRMDSFQAMSNMRAYSRTQLLVEILLRLYRILNEQDQRCYQEALAPYISQPSSKFVYGLSKSDIPHELEKLASVYHRLCQQLKASYGETEVFKIFERAYNEHFCIVSDRIVVRDSKEITSSSLQSPDDIDATFRHKAGDNYQGQVVNITETANPENKLNLITDVVVAANNIDDSTILNNRIDTIKAKTPDINEMHTDGGFGSEGNDKKMAEYSINHIQTAVRGRTPAVAITIEETKPGEHQVSCPLQQVQSQKTRKRFKACFKTSICEQCEHSKVCPSVAQHNARVFYFTQEMVLMQHRVRAIAKLPLEKQRLRPNIEATVKEYTKAFNHTGKLRVRGRFKTMLFAFAMSIGINFGRIFRFIMENPAIAKEIAWLKTFFSIFFKAIRHRLSHFYRCVWFCIPNISKNDKSVTLLSSM